jgi:hypothetical protein
MNIASAERQAKLAAVRASAQEFGQPVDERAEIRRLAALNRILRRIIAERLGKDRPGVDGGGDVG